jgi:SAM-dependent methyltransferase
VTDPRVELVARTYDEIADRFQEWGHSVEGDPRGWWAQELVSRLTHGSRVLELGCGAGSAETRLLAERFDVTGVDISAAQIDRARLNVPRARFIRADFTELKLTPGSFEAAASFYAFNHVPRDLLEDVLESVCTWLVPGGFFLVSLGAHDTAGWTGEWLGTTTYFSGYPPEVNRRLLTEAGLDIELDEVVTLKEPDAEVQFHWVLARR